MFKKLLAVSACLLICATLAMGEGEKKDRLFNINGSFEGGYKAQNNFKSPWDESGGLTEGAGNRASQPVLSEFDLKLLGIVWADGAVKYPEFMAYMVINGTSNDPDDEQASDVGIGEAFLFWKPHMALNFKIGRQTVTQTVNMGHEFWGPIEFDIVTLGSTVQEGDGLEISAYLGSSDHQVGVAVLNGSAKASDIYNSAKAIDTAKGGQTDTIIWYEGSLFEKALKIMLAQQSVAVVTSTKTDEGVTSADKSETHSFSNLFISYNAGFIKPYFGYWSSTGTNTLAGSTIPNTSFTYGDIGFDKDAKMSVMTFGFEMKDLGPGDFAFEYSTATTPEAGEAGSAMAVIDLKGSMSVDYQVEMRKDITMAYTYRQLITGDYFTNGDGKDTPMASALAWSPTTMMAVSIKYEF